MVYAKVMAKRRRLSFVPIMNNPFPQDIKIEWHHINDKFVVPVPKKYIIAIWVNNTE